MSTLSEVHDRQQSRGRCHHARNKQVTIIKPCLPATCALTTIAQAARMALRLDSLWCNHRALCTQRRRRCMLHGMLPTPALLCPRRSGHSAIPPSVRPSVCLSVPRRSCPRRAAALGYNRHAGCLQLSHVRTADPSADGRKSAAGQRQVLLEHVDDLGH